MSAEGRVITVFGSSRPREGDSHYALARQLGAELASRGFVICSGGYGGVMEAISRGAKEAGGRTIGIVAEFFTVPANRWIDDVISTKTWQDRLFALIERGAGYVACPGGTGTLVELSVVWEMLNKRVMRAKPFVTVGHFWQPIIERVREVEMGHTSEWGEATSRIIHNSDGPREAAEYLARMLLKLNAHLANSAPREKRR
ncbi:MAG TPA: LOG family protein [Candidatus Acidoferrales bacterium]|nr:LOG family protein [Candidatus Acidoferrales bacterium]